MSIHKGSDVVILDMEDVKKLVDGYRIVIDAGSNVRKSLSGVGCLDVYEDLLSIVREVDRDEA